MSVRGYYRITNRIERYLQLFLTIKQAKVGLHQLAIGMLLGLEQRQCFQMNQILDTLLTTFKTQINNSDRKQYTQGGRTNHDIEQIAHFTFKRCIAPH